MRKSVISILLCVAAGAPAAWANPGQMKPGLWEMSMKSDAFKNMPQMSPQQMEQMRKQGINVPHMVNGAMITKVCITKDMTTYKDSPMAQKETGCEVSNHQRSGGAYSTDLVCNGPDLKGKGKIKGTFSGDTAFSSTYAFDGTSRGKPVSQRHENSGRWLAADCGNVKPMMEMAAPKKK